VGAGQGGDLVRVDHADRVGGRASEDSSSPICTPSALARRQVMAMVGLAFSRSICDSIDFDTPAMRDRSSSVRPRARRRRCRVAPTSGGALVACIVNYSIHVSLLAKFNRPGVIFIILNFSST
jgi:hypothetical protein